MRVKNDLPKFIESSIDNAFELSVFNIIREKGRDLTQSYDNFKPLHRQKISKSNVTTHKRHLKLRLHSDCGPT